MLAVYVSGHGYGHSTRTAEVLGAVRARDARLPIAVSTSAPGFLFEGTVAPPLSVRRVECDVGLIQKDALVIDEDGTAEAWRSFRAGWGALVARESAWLREAGARLVLGDIPPLAFAAAAEAGVPSVALGNFSWDWIYGHLAGRVPALAEAAAHAAEAYARFLENPGPVVVGAVQGASCFGPAYEFAMILDADLRKRKVRDRVPMTFVTSEPYVGHMGLGGVGDSKGLLESELRQRHIKWITNAKVLEARQDSVKVAEHDDRGNVSREHELPSRFTMLIPAFKGVDAVAAVKEMCNPRGFVLIDEFQRNPKFRNIYAAGVCTAIPPVEVTPVPTGAPKTGYMIESMVTAIVHNIRDAIAGKEPTHKATWNAICLADLGDDGIAFVALPQIPPRNVTWARQGKWVHLAKIAYEKYFMRKMRTGRTDPIYENYVLKLLGIVRLKGASAIAGSKP